eukprot:1158663-Pelagomonas_calceolata.AAC.6
MEVDGSNPHGQRLSALSGCEPHNPLGWPPHRFPELPTLSVRIPVKMSSMVLAAPIQSEPPAMAHALMPAFSRWWIWSCAIAGLPAIKI